MKRKRLDRDGWGFQGFPYYQMRIDTQEFQGMLCMIRLMSGDRCFWHMPKAGRIAVCGAGMTWLQIVPDDAHYVLTAKIDRFDRINVWYADVIDRIEYDADGVAAFVDLYLDVIFSPQGDVKVDDREELDAARESGDVSDGQYAMALAEGENILRTLCTDVKATKRWCLRLLKEARRRAEHPDTLRRNVKIQRFAGVCRNPAKTED